MHELSYTTDVLDSVIACAKNAEAKEVRTVHMVIGEARDIVDELFKGCFGYYAQGTIAENAEVDIRRVPLTARCNRCGAIFPIGLHDAEEVGCPTCRGTDYGVLTGLEFYIDHIDVV